MKMAALPSKTENLPGNKEDHPIMMEGLPRKKEDPPTRMEGPPAYIDRCASFIKYVIPPIEYLPADVLRRESP